MGVPPRVTILLGHFGSGKTEVAISLARRLARGNVRPCLVDLDFITPFFRSRDAAAWLEREGVDVIAPAGPLAESDLPTIPGPALRALLSVDAPVVADVGGDEGARVIGSLATRLRPSDTRALLVVNPFRPSTREAKTVAGYARWVAAVARVDVAGLVANPHLGPATEPEHVRNGFRVVAETARALGVPVAYAAVRQDLVGGIGSLPAEVLPLRLAMRAPWEPGPNARSPGFDTPGRGRGGFWHG